MYKKSYKDYIDSVHKEIRETHPVLTKHVNKQMVKSILCYFNSSIKFYMKKKCYINLKSFKIIPNKFILYNSNMRKYKFIRYLKKIKNL